MDTSVQSAENLSIEGRTPLKRLSRRAYQKSVYRWLSSQQVKCRELVLES